MNELTFKLAEKKDKQLILDWLKQEHIQKWLHGVGLNNTLVWLDEFLEGISKEGGHWIAYYEGVPFAYLLTFPKGSDGISLDLFICDTEFLGRGLAVPMIKEFLKSQFSNIKTVYIDPEASNERAIHVYKKAGFKITHEFIAPWHPVLHYQMQLKNFL